MNSPARKPQPFLLRLPDTVRTGATEAAKSEGTSLNQFISLALAEKLTRHEIRKAAADRESTRSFRPAATSPFRPAVPIH